MTAAVRAKALDLIGNTPLVRLAGPSAEAGCDIYGKCEFLNPGGSIKDRIGLRMIEAAGEGVKLEEQLLITETGVEEDDIRTGVDEHRCEAVDELVGGQEIRLKQRADRFGRLVGAEGLLGIFRGACAILDHDDLELADIEAVSFGRHGVVDIHRGLRTRLLRDGSPGHDHGGRQRYTGTSQKHTSFHRNHRNLLNQIPSPLMRLTST